MCISVAKQCNESFRCFNSVFNGFFRFRILWKKNEVADFEATTFSIFYNNALYLVLIIVASFYVLRTFSPTLYPLRNYGSFSRCRWCYLLPFYFLGRVHKFKNNIFVGSGKFIIFESILLPVKCR